MNNSPVVLFAYNRPYHTEITLSSLSNNDLSFDTNLYIYLDFPKKKEDQILVNEVFSVCNSFSKKFKKVCIIKRSYNYGLADNILLGVSEVVERYGRVIVLEDDLLLSKYFLSYMNSALNIYNNIPSVWHVSGWNYPIESVSKNEAYFLPVMNCWGWATWKEKWQHYEKNTEGMMKEWSFFKIFKFNLYGVYNFWKQVKWNHKGIINTWAIFWYATIFENKGLCLNPPKSYVNNIGLDGSGENCSSYDPFNELICEESACSFPNKLDICKKNMIKIKLFYLRYKLSILHRLFFRLKDKYFKKNGE